MAHDQFFDTVLVEVPGRAGELIARAESLGINLRRAGSDHVGISCDETTTTEVITLVLKAFDVERIAPSRSPLGSELLRTTPYLQHGVFHEHRSETAMMRFLRKLSDRDLALDRTMIPLGSCTMKLNSAVEMAPISWPEFAAIHPHAPIAQTTGYRELIADLERWLAEITGYDRVSLQPNAGFQGELAGLLAIHGYHASRGEQQRRICLIPQSAHGTNAASAVLAGMQVVVVATAADGSIDLADLRAPRSAPIQRSWRPSCSPTRPPMVSTSPTSPPCAIWCTRRAARCTSTAPTSTRWWESRGRAISAATSHI
ncbi:glycine cleavage system P-family protein [Mycobacterium ulcerans str. Harvey]|uniref:Glycine cleavage system P-family protein n=1 Tax=Mycobacterium ulcerans str. Harvey TaxID=1299332 RepID=A0ABP3A9N8_MYCUL|nr:glycine cleavage system P-family protein [Mycobacterium ulcerans str. Harvey]